MRDYETLDIGDCIANFNRIDTIVDVRSESEFALDHWPGAINAPVLHDEQRALVGTLYKQVGSFEAKRVGAALVARNIGQHLETLFADRPRTWRPLIYCWRGGNRSGAMATVLSRVGWHTSLLNGGYRSFRGQVNADLDSIPKALRFHVVAGRTGSAKTALLGELMTLGAQVLDLEGLALHRGSVLGSVPHSTQPPQKWFETRVWELLRAFDPGRPIFVESESKKIGQIHVPEALIRAMRASNCTIIAASTGTRVEHLIREYPFFLERPDELIRRLDHLRALHGADRVEQWRGFVASGRWSELIEALLRDHYDPAYDRSMRRNFARFSAAAVVPLRSADANALHEAAQLILRGTIAGLPIST